MFKKIYITWDTLESAGVIDLLAELAGNNWKRKVEDRMLSSTVDNYL